MKCACGCGEQFEPRRKNHRYVDGHRKIDPETTVVRIPRREAEKLKARMALQNPRKSCVHGIVATEGAEVRVYRQTIRPAASWPPADNQEGTKLPGFGRTYLRGNVWWVKYRLGAKGFRESSRKGEAAGTASDAEKLLTKRHLDWTNGRQIPLIGEDRLLVDELFGLILLDYRLNNLRSLPSLKYRLSHLRLSFAGYRAVDVTESRVERYKASRLDAGAKPGTVNRELAALRRTFKLGVQQKRISHAPNISLLEENNVRQGFVEQEQFEEIMAYLPDYLQDMARFSMASGWRRGPICSLRWADMDMTARVIQSEGKTLSLTGELWAIIVRRQEQRLEAEFVFHRQGRKVGNCHITWQKACRKAGVPGLLFDGLPRPAKELQSR